MLHFLDCSRFVISPVSQLKCNIHHLVTIIQGKPIFGTVSTKLRDPPQDSSLISDAHNGLSTGPELSGNRGDGLSVIDFRANKDLLIG